MSEMKKPIDILIAAITENSREKIINCLCKYTKKELNCIGDNGVVFDDFFDEDDGMRSPYNVPDIGDVVTREFLAKLTEISGEIIFHSSESTLTYKTTDDEPLVPMISCSRLVIFNRETGRYAIYTINAIKVIDGGVRIDTSVCPLISGFAEYNKGVTFETHRTTQIRKGDEEVLSCVVGLVMDVCDMYYFSDNIYTQDKVASHD